MSTNAKRKTVKKASRKVKPALRVKAKKVVKAYKNPNGVTRSVLLKKPLLAYLEQKAKRTGRSVNWLINDMVDRDTNTVEAATPATHAAPQS